MASSASVSTQIHNRSEHVERRPVARMSAQVAAKATQCSPTLDSAPCGAPGAHRGAMWASPARQKSTLSADGRPYHRK